MQICERERIGEVFFYPIYVYVRRVWPLMPLKMVYSCLFAQRYCQLIWFICKVLNGTLNLLLGQGFHNFNSALFKLIPRRDAFGNFCDRKKKIKHNVVKYRANTKPWKMAAFTGSFRMYSWHLYFRPSSQLFPPFEEGALCPHLIQAHLAWKMPTLSQSVFLLKKNLHLLSWQSKRSPDLFAAFFSASGFKAWKK